MKNIKAFTLMELMIVIAIIMILSGAIVARIGTGSDKAKIAKAKAEMEEIASAMRAFYMDTGYYPFAFLYGGNSFGSSVDSGLLNKENITDLVLPDGWRAWSRPLPTGTSNPDLFNGVKASWRGPYLDAASWPKDPWGKLYYRIRYDEHVGVLVVASAGPNGNYDCIGNYANQAGDDLVYIVYRSSQVH